MNKLSYSFKPLAVVPVLAIVGLMLLGGIYTETAADAQEAMRPKGKIRCWIECCPLKISCEFDIGAYSAARRGVPNASIVVRGNQLIAEFKRADEQKIYDVKSEMKLDAKTAEALGFKEIMLLPGQYPLTSMANDMVKVSIKVRTVAAPPKAQSTQSN